MGAASRIELVIWGNSLTSAGRGWFFPALVSAPADLQTPGQFQASRIGFQRLFDQRLEAGGMTFLRR